MINQRLHDPKIACSAQTLTSFNRWRESIRTEFDNILATPCKRRSMSFTEKEKIYVLLLCVLDLYTKHSAR